MFHRTARFFRFFPVFEFDVCTTTCSKDLTALVFFMQQPLCLLRSLNRHFTPDIILKRWYPTSVTAVICETGAPRYPLKLGRSMRVLYSRVFAAILGGCPTSTRLKQPGTPGNHALLQRRFSIKKGGWLYRNGYNTSIRHETMISILVRHVYLV